MGVLLNEVQVRCHLQFVMEPHLHKHVCMRGSHQMPLMPVTLNSGISYFDGPPVVSCAGFCVHNGKLTEPIDGFV